MSAAPRRERVVVVLLLAMQAVLLFYSSRANFVTTDEPGYFAAAITNWRRGTFDLYRVNPPLVRMLAVLPVLPLDVREEYRNWQPDEPGARDELYVGRDFVAANGPRYLDFMRRARLSAILWALLGSWLIYAWARRLFGARAGLLALALWCFEPNVLAHGCLITPDIPAAVAGAAALFVFWRFLERPGWGLALAAGALLGIALLTKFTNLYLLVALPLLVLVKRLGARRVVADGAQRPKPTGRLRLAMIAGVALVIVNAGYAFHETLRPLGSLVFVSSSLKGDEPTGNRFRDTWVGRIPVPVPADYVKGMDVQHHDFEGRFKSYLNGEWRDHGWWYYYLYALAIKVPLGTIALVLLGLWQFLRDRQADSLGKLAVLLPVVLVMTLVSSQVGFNSHLRYVLPIFPFLAIVAGRSATCRGRSTIVVVLLLLGSIGSSMRVYPHSLSYFNELVGGAAHGDDHLVDSNIDWGQDLLALKTWVDANAPDVPMELAYFGGADPSITGLRYTLPPRYLPGFGGSQYDQELGPHPGLFAVSVNFLRGLRFAAPDGSGQWHGVGPTDFTYFMRFRPIGTAGYSIRIYCLRQDEADEARTALGFQPLSPWSSASTVDCSTFRR